MKNSQCSMLLGFFAGVWMVPNGVQAQSLNLERVASGLSRPVYATHAPGDSGNLYVVEQTSGNIQILDLNTRTLAATPFLTVNGLSTGNEQGLLGLAFHPNYSANGQFYTNAVKAGGTVIERFSRSVNAMIADPVPSPVLGFGQPQSNHNGGWMDFDSDGYLYIASGDGGSGNDSGTGHTIGIGNAQDTSNLLGAMLRIDVNTDDFPMDLNRNYGIPATNPLVGVEDAAEEIFAYGLRNPWRNSFDSATGDLFIADVGQGGFEELDVILAGDVSGPNFGWRLREGTSQTPTVGGAKPADAIDPFYEYSHADGFSITGG